MDIPIGAYIIVLGMAFLISFGLTPLARRWGRQWGLIAIPGGRRQHKEMISRMGGLPVFAGFILAVLAAQIFIVSPGNPIRNPLFQIPRFDPKETIRLTGLIVGSTFIFLAGLYDDWKELRPMPQMVVQLIAAAIAVSFLIFIEYFNNPITGQQTETFPFIITLLITLFWLGLMMNTVNWLDGLDGLASGVVAIACIVLFINAAFRLNPPQESVAILPVALLGAVLGFLPFNFSPAKIFLGSAGAYLLGYALGVLSIIGGAKMAAILLVMGLPLLDVVWQIVSRLVQGKSPMQGDRGHLHFRLLDLGLSQRQIVLGYYVFCTLFGGLALFIPSRQYKLVALGLMGLLALLGFVWLMKQQDRDK